MMRAHFLTLTEVFGVALQVFSALQASAQSGEPCGMRGIDGDGSPCEGCWCGACDSAAERDSWNPTLLAEEQFMTIHVRFVILRDDNQLNAAATEQEVNNQLVELNDAFREYKIQFEKGMANTFENSTHHLYFCSGGGDCFCESDFCVGDCWSDPAQPPYADRPEAYEAELKYAYVVNPDQMLNIYVTDMSEADGVKGYGYFPWCNYSSGPLNGVIMDKAYFGGASDCDGESCRLLAHEIGHVLGLWHTFHGGESLVGCSFDCYEPAACTGDCTSADPDCNTVGDRCCDTPASAMGSLETCVEGTAGLEDPCSQNAEMEAADYTNYMDYAEAGCWDHFTAQQVSRMFCWTCNSVPGWIDSPDCNNNDKPDVCDISRGTSEDCDEDGVPDECQSSGACCLSNVAGDCVQTPTSACCDALDGLNWYGMNTRCRDIDCSEGPMGPQ